jgi:hypothetical protein
MPFNNLGVSNRIGDGPGPGAFGWEGEVDPPMIITHRGHRPRGFAAGFPLFPRGHRDDPLGGTLASVQPLQDLQPPYCST